MSGKRILIVTSELVPFHYGGIGTQFKSLAAFLKRHGNKVYLLVRKPDNYDEALYKSHYGETPLFFVDVPPIQTGSPQHFVYAAEVARRFDEIYPEIRPDLVIFADFNAESLFLLLRSGTGAYAATEFLLTINGMNYEVISVHEGDRERTSHQLFDLPDIRMLLAMEDLCVHLAQTIVSPTVCAWEEVRQRLGIRKTARIIPNLVDLDLFRPEKTGIREEPQEPLILFVGRLDRMKGTDLLLQAYFDIADRMHPAIPRIIFIGRDCYWNEYGSTFLEYWKNRIPEKYAGAISFLGQVSHDLIRDYFEKATVAVFPSRWEPFGIVCLEALSMGCPVVVSKGTGLEEVLGPALSEFAIPVTEDIQPLARKILSLLHGDPYASSEKLRKRALEVVRQAETGWLDLLRDIDRKDRMEEPAVKALCGSLHQLLASLEDSRKGTAHLQIYFRHLGGYVESDSLRVSYSRLCWTALMIPLSAGTGERPLRLDPADAPGTIRIKEIVLLDEAGTEIWRADGANRFQGCNAGGKDAWSFRNDCLVIEAETDDPQMLLDCPPMDRPAKMSVTLYAGDD
jgi:glycosyltransferase involved in cell wall biosynthesis